MLDEQFVYDTGESETRTWLVTPLGDGRFRATCADCIGSANGESDADSVRMSYRFRLKLKDREIVVAFDDRLYRMGDTTAVNRATMSKWGIKLGELSLFFQRAEIDSKASGRHGTRLEAARRSEPTRDAQIERVRHQPQQLQHGDELPGKRDLVFAARKPAQDAIRRIAGLHDVGHGEFVDRRHRRLDEAGIDEAHDDAVAAAVRAAAPRQG